MCYNLSKEEMDELIKNPGFCIVCFCNRDDIRVDKDHVCEECRKGTNGSPRRLPTVTLENGKTYFIDERLRQLRNVHNPHDFMDF